MYEREVCCSNRRPEVLLLHYEPHCFPQICIIADLCGGGGEAAAKRPSLWSRVLSLKSAAAAEMLDSFSREDWLQRFSLDGSCGRCFPAARTDSFPSDKDVNVIFRREQSASGCWLVNEASTWRAAVLKRWFVSVTLQNTALIMGCHPVTAEHLMTQQLWYQLVMPLAAWVLAFI